MAGKKRTMREWAQRLQVSPATISNVIHDKPGKVSSKTRERIVAALKADGYAFGQKAKPLGDQNGNRNHEITSPGARRSIGFVGVNIYNTLSNEWFHGNLHAAADGCMRHHFALNLMMMDAWDPRYCQFMLDEYGLAGALVVANTHHPVIGMLEERNIPHILLDCYDTGDRYNVVHLDNSGGAAAAVRYLLDLGHRRIGFIGGLTEASSAVYRQQGYLQALQKAGVQPDADWIHNGHFTELGGESAAKILLQRTPDLTALFAASDDMALGAIRGLHELGCRVPDDVSVVGFDGTRRGQKLQPPLTSVSVDPYQVGQTAFAMLLRLLETKEPRIAKVKMDVSLMVGGTSAPPRPLKT